MIFFVVNPYYPFMVDFELLLSIDVKPLNVVLITLLTLSKRCLLFIYYYYYYYVQRKQEACTLYSLLL